MAFFAQSHISAFVSILLAFVVALVSTSSAILLFSLLKPESVHPYLRSTISFFCNALLQRKYQVVQSGARNRLPGTKYQWPNGEGDVGKYVEGRKNFEQWRQKFGDIYYIWAGMNPNVVISKPEHVEAVFKDSDTHIKARNADSGDFMSWVLGQCLGLMSGQKWKTLKAAVAPAFHQRATIDVLPRTKAQIQRHFTTLENTGNLSRGMIHPTQDFKMIPFINVAETIYGPLSADAIAELNRLVPSRERLFMHVIKGGLTRFSFSRYLPIAPNRELWEFKRAWRSFNATVCAQSIENSEEALATQLYAMAQESQLSCEEVDQTLDELLFANLDVTSSALSWTLVFLAASKESRDRLEQEIKLLEGENEERAYIARNDSYLSACLSESARLRPVAATTIPQSAPTDKVLDGYTIPAGTNIIVDAFALNIDSEIWGPDNTTFRPDRFLGTNKAKMRYAFSRYGFGPRQCIGKYTADIVTRVVILHVVKNYNLGLLDEQDWTTDPDCWMSRADLLLSCTKKLGHEANE